MRHIQIYLINLILYTYTLCDIIQIYLVLPDVSAYIVDSSCLSGGLSSLSLEVKSLSTKHFQNK